MALYQPALVRRWIHQWGRYAALRHAAKSGVPFATAYIAVTGKSPVR